MKWSLRRLARRLGRRIELGGASVVTTAMHPPQAHGRPGTGRLPINGL